jgi:hypothetical protein
MLLVLVKARQRRKPELAVMRKPWWKRTHERDDSGCEGPDLPLAGAEGE